MKKQIFITIISIILSGNKNAFSQESELNKFYQEIAKVRHELNNAENDTILTYRMHQLCDLYKFNKPDSAIYFGNKAAALAIKINKEDMVPSILAFMVLAHMNIGNDAQALQLALDGLRKAERLNSNWEIADFHSHLGVLYRNAGYFAESLNYFRKSSSIFESINDTVSNSIAEVQMANTFLSFNNLDSAQYFFEHAYKISQPFSFFIPYHRLIVLSGMGRINAALGNYNLSLSYFRQSLNLSVVGYRLVLSKL